MNKLVEFLRNFWILHSPSRLYILLTVAEKNGYRRGYREGYQASYLHACVTKENVSNR